MPAKKPASESVYFDLQADWGITKHMGGLKATRELIELCHITRGHYVLVVGGGIGTTPVYLARQHGCRVANDGLRVTIDETGKTQVIR